jgi:hypothetical protein
MANVTQKEMQLLNEIKAFTETKFSSSNYMWAYTDSLDSDMKVNRGLMSSLLQKGIIVFDSYECVDDAVKVDPNFWSVSVDDVAEFKNLNLI